MTRVLFLLVCFTAALTAGSGSAGGRRGLAILTSAGLPGTGQVLLGDRTRGEALAWLDGILWVTWGGFTWYSASRSQDALLTAAAESGADIHVTDPKYYRALERYDNADEHNEDIRREARDRYPTDPEAQRRYHEARGYFGEQSWDWSSDSARFDFWRTRKKARTAASRAGFVGGALLLNRLVSIIDCAFFAGAASQQSRLELGSGTGLASVEVRYRF